MFEPILLLTFVVGLVSGLLSGVTGAGGGLIVAPYLMLIGLPPASAVATPKLAGVGVGIGSLPDSVRLDTSTGIGLSV